MAESFKEMRVFAHAYYCDTCTDLAMLPVGPGLVPGTTSYKCPKCKETKSLEKRLPQVYHLEDGMPFPEDFKNLAEDVLGPEGAAKLDIYAKKIVPS